MPLLTARKGVCPWSPPGVSFKPGGALQPPISYWEWPKGLLLSTHGQLQQAGDTPRPMYSLEEHLPLAMPLVVVEPAPVHLPGLVYQASVSWRRDGLGPNPTWDIPPPPPACQQWTRLAPLAGSGFGGSAAPPGAVWVFRNMPGSHWEREAWDPPSPRPQSPQPGFLGCAEWGIPSGL